MNCNKGKRTHGEKDKESGSKQQYRLITAEKVKELRVYQGLQN